MPTCGVLLPGHQQFTGQVVILFPSLNFILFKKIPDQSDAKPRFNLPVHSFYL
jgi:hypothetical protein